MSNSANTNTALLEMREIAKSFPGVRALDGVTFDLFQGEIHALVGENGAGKSTLIKILGGVYPHPQYGGEILIEGKAVRFAGVRDAETAGVAVIYQELSLVPEMTVGENIFLGREPRRFGVIRWNQLYAEAATLLEKLNQKIDPGIPVRELGIGQQQMIEIAKALSQDARILVLDEPTAALTETEADSLFSLLDKLKARGVSMIYISHKLDEVFRLSSRITVLRDGRTIGTELTSDLDEKRVIAMMVGREISHLFPTPSRTQGEVVFETKDVVVDDPTTGRRLVDHVGFKVRSGEVLGVAGLMGAGRSELLMALFGAHAGKRRADIFVGGKPVSINSPSEAISHGIGFVTEDRKRFGLVLDQTILNNMTLAGLTHLSGKFVTNLDAEISKAEPMKRDLNIKAPYLFTIAETLSGGNQQKVVLAKWLLNEPRVLFLDEPTRGIDVGAKQEFYTEIDRLAQSGIAIVLVSSELPEVMGLSDRILVLHEGRVSGEFARGEATPEKIMSCATGSGLIRPELN